MQPPAVEDASAAIRNAYQQAWERVLAEQETLLNNPKAATRRKRLLEMAARIADDMDGLDEEAARWIGQQLPRLYALGGSATAGSFTFSQIDQQAVQLLADDLFSDLLGATRKVRETTKTLIREVGKREITQGLLTGDPAGTTARRMRDLLQARRIHAVRYKDGSRHGLGEYADMAVRTKSGVAYNTGALNSSQEVKFFEVFDGPQCGWTFHEDPDLAAGKIVGREEAAQFIISHPRCRRSFGPRPDILTKAEAAKAQGSVTPGQIAAQRAQDAERLQAQANAARRRRGDPVAARRAKTDQALKRREQRLERNRAARRPVPGRG